MTDDQKEGRDPALQPGEDRIGSQEQEG